LIESSPPVGPGTSSAAATAAATRFCAMARLAAETLTLPPLPHWNIIEQLPVLCGGRGFVEGTGAAGVRATPLTSVSAPVAATATGNVAALRGRRVSGARA
jgi:hypothetical protein